jgi:hypothetical protein
MNKRIKCKRCPNQILEVTAKANNGLCGPCRNKIRDAELRSKAIPIPDYSQTDSNICEHLKPLENDLMKESIRLTFRGKPWSYNCNEWVYFDCFLDRKAIEQKYQFPSFISYHEYDGRVAGQEAGFVCEKCKTAVMGVHKLYSTNTLIFRPS